MEGDRGGGEAERPALPAGPIVVPGPLLDAQERGELVVFAGAGVSMGAPSGFPGYEGLTEVLRGGVPLERRAGEPPDRYLGRLQKEGLDIEGRARRVFTDRVSRPTPLHEALLRLFPDGRSVRVVTTNYDDHFCTAARRVFGPEGGVERWAAPALPRGDDFRGVVHLHGSAWDGRSRLVLSDRDFGRAYLTEAWARDFLVALYGAADVLFVGYSHTDAVLSYLARGLTSNSRPRWALAPSGGATDWDVLEVRAIPYAVGPDGSHDALTKGVRAWARYARQSEVERELDVAQVVASREGRAERRPLTPRAEGLLRQVVRDPLRVRYFTRHARSTYWLTWAEREGLLAPLFGTDRPVGRDVELAAWFVRTYALEHPGEARSIMARHGGRLGPHVAGEVAQRLVYEAPPGGADAAEWFGYWASVLVASGVEDGILADLLGRAASLRLTDPALMLFEVLTRPEVAVERNHFFRVFGDEPAERKTTLGVRSWSRDVRRAARAVWRGLFREERGTVGWRLLHVTAEQLMRGHDVLRAGGPVGPGGVDAWGAAVRAKDEEAGGGEPLPAFLFRAAEEALGWARDVDRRAADGVVRTWRRSGYPLLIRLALREQRRALAAGEVGASAVLDGLRAEGWALWPAVEEDAAALARDAFAGAGARARRRFLRDVRGRVDRGDVHPLRAWRLLHEMQEEVTDEEGLAPLVDALWAEWEGTRGDDAAVEVYLPVEPLLSGAPLDVVDELLRRTVGRGAEAARYDVGRAAAGNPAWAFALAREVAAREAWDAPLWHALYDGMDRVVWRRLEGAAEDEGVERPGAGEVLAWLGGLRRLPLPDRAARWVAEGVRSTVLGDEARASAEAVLTRVYGQTRRRPEGGGGLVEALVAASARWREPGGLPFLYQDLLNAVMASGKGDALTEAGAHVDELWTADAAWVRARLLPLLRGGGARAAAAWSGVLQQTEWMGTEAFRAVLPYAVEALPDLVRAEARQDERVAHLFARAARLFPEVGLGEWHPAFVWEAPVDLRVRWIEEVGGGAPVAAAADANRVAWEGWMRGFWAGRNEGSPRRLHGREAGALLRWVVMPGVPIGEAIDLLIEGPPIEEPDRWAVARLKELADGNPEPVARLALRLVQDVPDAVYKRWATQVLEAVLGADRRAYEALVDALVGRGHLTADEARRALGGGEAGAAASTGR